MAEKRRKSKGERVDNKSHNNKNKKKKDDSKRKKSGPRLPSQLQKEIDFLNPNPTNTEDATDSDDSERVIERNNLYYEYEEPIPQEESKKNRRFDPVDNLEYELPDHFEDENVPSSDDDVDMDKLENTMDSSDESKLEAEEEDADNDRHTRMLQGVTGMPGEVFEGKKRKTAVLTEALPESECNINRTASSGSSHISIHDLLDPLHGKPGYSKLRKRMHQLERHSTTVTAPLPKAERERLERKAAYEQSKKDLTKWEPLVKRNREAPTIYFDEDMSAVTENSTVDAIVAAFKPRTEFEKKIASIVNHPKIAEAHNHDGARLLELNKISVEDERDRQNRLAKMRSLLFSHEIKAKRIKKIKSKTFHRQLKKNRLKSTSSEVQMDPEAANEYAKKHEFKRAKERMTLKHKNSTKWAKRILKRGLSVQDEGTRAAFSEQNHQGAVLTRKIESMKNDSSDDSSDEDEDDGSVDGEDSAMLLMRAKEKTLKVIEEADEMPKKGVLSLPFMARAMKKEKEAAYEEAQLALQEYDSSMRQQDDLNGTDSLKQGFLSGRRVFGVAKKQSQEVCNRFKADISGKDHDSDEEFEPKENVDMGNEEKVSLQKDVRVDPSLLLEESDIGQGALFKSFDDIVKDPGPKTSYEVSIFASDSWKKMKSDKGVCSGTKTMSTVVEPHLPEQDLYGIDQHSVPESEEEMVDGILSSDAMNDYKLPSQADLIHSAFAGDDVEGEFEKDKLEVLNEENPEPEKPVLLPGWGEWTHIQQRKGLPSWMVEEHENARRKREDALKKRKDAKFKHVIISEKIDKKAEKLYTKTLPFPFTSKEIFEQSMRMPLGPDFNPATSVRALNQPAVVKKPGVIIKPIKLAEVNPYDKAREPWRGGQTAKMMKNKGAGGKGSKNINMKNRS